MSPVGVERLPLSKRSNWSRCEGWCERRMCRRLSKSPAGTGNPCHPYSSDASQQQGSSRNTVSIRRVSSGLLFWVSRLLQTNTLWSRFAAQRIQEHSIQTGLQVSEHGGQRSACRQLPVGHGLPEALESPCEVALFAVHMAGFFCSGMTAQPAAQDLSQASLPRFPDLLVVV